MRVATPQIAIDEALYLGLGGTGGGKCGALRRALCALGDAVVGEAGQRAARIPSAIASRETETIS